MLFGVVDQQKGRKTLAEEDWKVPPERVKAPYAKRSNDELTPEYRGHEKSGGKPGGPPPKPKYELVTDSA